MKNLNGCNLNECILRSSTVEKLPVRMEWDANNLCFCGGWEDFVTGQSLEAGDFLVCKYYLCDSKFRLELKDVRLTMKTMKQCIVPCDSYVGSGKKPAISEAEKGRKRSVLSSPDASREDTLTDMEKNNRVQVPMITSSRKFYS